MADWPALQARCESLAEPYRSFAQRLYGEAKEAVEHSPDAENEIFWQVGHTLTSVEYDAAANGSEAPEIYYQLG